MILRHLALRHGRRAIARPASSFVLRQWQRSISSQGANRATASDTYSEEDDAFLSTEVDPIVADWSFRNHQYALTAKTGADKTQPYNPMDLITNPVKPQDITLELLLASQTHLGHQTSLWHPGNARHIHGIWGEEHDSIHIISLDATAAHLRRACKVMKEVAFRGGLILFVGTRKGQALSVVRAAELAGACHLFDWWKPGTITNAQSILGKCATKVVDMTDQELPGFEPQLRKKAALIPDLVVCLNPLENNVLLTECGQANIPTIGIVDTDCNPTWVTYAIPANDDSQRSVSVIAGALGQAAREGLLDRQRRGRAGRVDFIPATGLRPPTQGEIDEAKRKQSNLSTFDVEEDEELEFEIERSSAVAAPTETDDMLAAEELDRDDVGATEQLTKANDDYLTSLDSALEEELTPGSEQSELETSGSRSDDIDLDLFAEYNVSAPANLVESEAELLSKSKSREAKQVDAGEMEKKAPDSQETSRGKKDEQKDEKSKD